MKGTVSYRWRFAAGLFIGLAVGLSLLYWIYRDSRSELAREQAERSGIISLLSLTQLISQTGLSGDPVREAVNAVAANNPNIRSIRVLRGPRLEASTAKEDSGEKAAPRRLAREEKPIFDLGQRLRAAVQTNQEEEVARKQEIEIYRLDSGALRLAAPVEQDGAVTGFVLIETAPPKTNVKTSTLVALLTGLIAFAVFIALSFFIGEKKTLLALASFVLMIAALVWYGIYIRNSVSKGTEEVQQTLARQLVEESKRNASVLSKLGIQPTSPSVPSNWDTDLYRKPRGLLTDAGTIQQKVLQTRVQDQNSRLYKFLAGLFVLSLGLLAFFGLGAATWLWGTIVRYRQAYLYTTPAMVGMLILVFFPFFYGIAVSFTGSTLYNTDKPITEIWVGLQNYSDILGDFSIVRKIDQGLIFNYKNFYYTFLFTVLWTVSNVTIGVTVGLILALILNTKGLALRPLYRVLLIFPWAMPNYITALIWRGMFHQQFGVINHVIQMFGGNPISWFEKPFTSFMTALATNGWLSFPFMMVVSLGALQSIPADLYEAARVDGATRWQQFKSITLPSLRPALVPAIILSVVWTFNMFNIIFLVTQGEPASSTEILITQAYKIAFQQYRYGYAAAYSTIIFLILLVYGTIQNRMTKATEAIA
jgi:arabinogalactan oligomer/maltooligosaccharide transport system permease protein